MKNNNGLRTSLGWERGQRVGSILMVGGGLGITVTILPSSSQAPSQGRNCDEVVSQSHTKQHADSREDTKRWPRARPAASGRVRAARASVRGRASWRRAGPACGRRPRARRRSPFAPGFGLMRWGVTLSMRVPPGALGDRSHSSSHCLHFMPEGNQPLPVFHAPRKWIARRCFARCAGKGPAWQTPSRPCHMGIHMV